MAELACGNCGGRIRTDGLAQGWSVRCGNCRAMWTFDTAVPGAQPHLVKPGDYGGPRPGQGEGQVARRFRDWLQTLEGSLIPGLIALNLTVYAAMWAAGLDPWMPGAEALKDWQAIDGPRVREGGYHRLFTAMFVHVGAVHLCFNIASLWWIGSVVEGQIGPLRTLLVYVLSGLGGSINALYWSPYSVTAGASGAIFGLDGALLALLWVNRYELMSSVAGPLRQALIANTIMNLVVGFGLRFVSNSGHIGGLVCGLLIGVGLCRIRMRRPVLTGREWATTIGAALLLAGAAVLAARSIEPGVDPALRRKDAREFFREFAAVHRRLSELRTSAESAANADPSGRAHARDQIGRDMTAMARRHADLGELAPSPEYAAALEASGAYLSALRTYTEAATADAPHGERAGAALKAVQAAEQKLIELWRAAREAPDSEF